VADDPIPAGERLLDLDPEDAARLRWEWGERNLPLDLRLEAGERNPLLEALEEMLDAANYLQAAMCPILRLQALTLARKVRAVALARRKIAP
jgi:hypothetical protein